MLWTGVFTGPAAWTLQILINYNLEELACSEATTDVGRIWGVGVATWILIVDVVLIAVTAIAGLLAFRCLRRVPADDGSPGGRIRWMAAVGVMVSILFLIVIVSGLAPPLVLNVCEVSP